MDFDFQEPFSAEYIADEGQQREADVSAQAQGYTNFDVRDQIYQQEFQNNQHYHQQSFIYNEYQGRFQPRFDFSHTLQEPREQSIRVQETIPAPVLAPVPAQAPAPAPAPIVTSTGSVTERIKTKAPKKLPKKAKSNLATNAWLSSAFKVKTIVGPGTYVRRNNGTLAVYRSRKLVLVNSGTPEDYGRNLAQMLEEELPEIVCPVAGCARVVRGRKMLEEHLSDGWEEGGHGFVTNKSGRQERMACVAGWGRCVEAQGEQGIAVGGMTRHLVEHHTNVWIYCVACNFSSSREFNVWRHFKMGP